MNIGGVVGNTINNIDDWGDVLVPPVSELTPEHNRRHIWMGMQDVAPSVAAARDGNGYETSAGPNPTGADMGLSLCSRAQARVQL